MKGVLVFLLIALGALGAEGYRFHVLGASHLPVSRVYGACAFTQKIVKLCRMLRDRGHYVMLYGAEGTDSDLADEWIMTHRLEDIRRDFGDANYTGEHEIGYEWQEQGEGFRHDFSDHVPTTDLFYRRAIKGILQRKQDDDFLLCPLGLHQKPVADAVGLELTAEPGIGYRGSFARWRAFESIYIQYFTLGSQNPGKGLDGEWYHRVIPNYYELDDFPYQEQAEQPRYYLFLARIIRRKGLQVAIDVCTKLNLRLIIAGQGHKAWFPENRTLIDQGGNTYQLTERMQFVGYANATYRSQLMRGATAVFTPTLFLEPFCGVAVEAQLSGSPVITSNFGAFYETVEHGRTGYRCNTMMDFMEAALAVEHLDRRYIRRRAERLYSTESVALLFEKWWRDLYHVYESIATKGATKGWNRMPEWYREEDYIKDEL